MEYYRTYASTKGGFDLYKVTGLSEEESEFIGNYDTLGEADKAGGNMGLEIIPMYLKNQMDN